MKCIVTAVLFPQDKSIQNGSTRIEGCGLWTSIFHYFPDSTAVTLRTEDIEDVV